MATFQFNICDISLSVSSIDGSSLKTRMVPLLSVNHDPIGSAFTLQKSSKMSPYRRKPVNESTMLKSPPRTYIRSIFQIPSSSEKQDVQTLIFFEAEEIHINFDPKLYDWFLYFPVKNKASLDPPTTANTSIPDQGKSVPKTNVSNETVSGLYQEIVPSVKKGGDSEPPIMETKPKAVKKETRSHTANSDKGTLKMSHQRGKYLTRSGSNVREFKDVDYDINKYFLDLISKWFPTLNATLIQVRMDLIHIFIPKKR